LADAAGLGVEIRPDVQRDRGAGIGDDALSGSAREASMAAFARSWRSMKRWMAEIGYRDGRKTDIVTFEEISELERIVESGPDWHEIENIVITLNRSARLPDGDASPDRQH
jgi:hypothetical protein